MVRSILAVFAHPDDESFGPGGTLAKYAAEGVEITLVVASRGEQSTLGSSLEHGVERLGDVREDELRCAAEVLGIKHLRVLDYPDAYIQEIGTDELRAVIRVYIEQLRPDVVLTFDSGGITGNPDHIAVTEATTEAFNVVFAKHNANVAPKGKLYYWAIPDHIASHLREISDIGFAGKDDALITTIIDVSEFREHQWEAICCHKSQSSPVPRVLQERLDTQDGKEFFVRVSPPGQDSVTEDGFFD